MKILAAILVAGALLGGCATHEMTVAQTTAPVNVYRGEVWTWDPTLNVITLLQGDQKVRVLVTPDQLLGLHERDIVAVRGVPAPPVQLEQFVVQAPPMRAVPTGPVDMTEISGTVAAVDPAGKISIATSRGPIDAWVGTPINDRFRVGTPVQMKTSVQAVSMVPLAGGVASSAPEPAALAATEPGDHAVITGRILGIDPAGRMTVESPRGPVNVWVPAPQNYAVGQEIQLRTSVTAAR
jgi:hypothetical protein